MKLRIISFLLFSVLVSTSLHSIPTAPITKPLTKQQLSSVISNQLIAQAVNACPEYVPDEVKKKIEEFKKKNKRP